MRLYTYNEIRDTDDSGVSWWEEIFIRSFVHALTFLFANYTRFTPNQITVMSFIFGLLSACCFLNGTRYYLIAGALLFEFSFILDCIDGRIARLKGLKSIFGAYLDIMSDITKYFFIILALSYGQYLLTKDVIYLLYGYVFMFFELTVLTSSYVIRFYQPEESDMNRKDVYQTRYAALNNRLPLLMKLKKMFDCDNKLSFIPFSPIEAETIVLFVAPIMMQVELGIIVGSIILFINILIEIVFNFSLKKKWIAK
jgi:phosphatidylglycerophosphate synthase